MNYTEKHHLPQWEENDRVMRTDFNDAMAALEAGLTGAEALTRSLSAEGETAAREQLKKGLFRAAYNHYHCLVSLPEAPVRAGVWQQDFRRDNVFVTNTVSLGGRIWTAGCTQPLTLNLLKSTIEQTSVLSSESDTCTLTFTPPEAGVIHQLILSGRYSNNTNGNTGACTVTLRNLTTGKVEAVLPHSFALKHTALIGNLILRDINFVLHAKQTYQLDVKLDKLDFTLDYKFDLDYSSCIVLGGVGPKPVSLGHSFSDDNPSMGGLFIAHYTTYGGGNRVTLSWPEDEEELEATKTREITDQYGNAVTEAEFQIWREHPGPGRAVLNLRCAAGGEIALYEWGGVLI